MKDFQGKVAVVTGAASGIGRALAEQCAQEGMKVVLADVEERALKQAEEELQTSGAQQSNTSCPISQRSHLISHASLLGTSRRYSTPPSSPQQEELRT